MPARIRAGSEREGHSAAGKRKRGSPRPDGWTIEDTALHVARAGRAQQPPRWADAEGLADALLKGTVRPEEVHEIERLIWGIKDRLTREKIAQALAAAKPASLAAAKQVVEAQTPLPLADDDAEIEADSQPPDPLMWPAESSLDEPSLDEPSLEQEYHDSHDRLFERQAEKRFRAVAQGANTTAVEIHRRTAGRTGVRLIIL